MWPPPIIRQGKKLKLQHDHHLWRTFGRIRIARLELADVRLQDVPATRAREVAINLGDTTIRLERVDEQALQERR